MLTVDFHENGFNNTSEGAGNRVAVLIATYNGDAFLEEQLQSLADQQWSEIDVWVSDDGSTDKTMEILCRWERRWVKGKFVILKGPEQGFSANFRALITNPDIQADFVAFCDQDDIWLREKTSRSVEALIGAGDSPSMFGTRTLLVDERDREIGRSPLFTKPPHFRNALVQNISGGNTMTMNWSAYQIVRQIAEQSDFTSHDWFAYLVVAATGGSVIYAATPLVRYRQHGSNVVGSNRGSRAWLTRMKFVLQGRFRDWNDNNLKVLAICRHLLTSEAQETVDYFSRARDGSIWSRVHHLQRSRVYRQTLAGQMSLYLACILNRL